MIKATDHQNNYMEPYQSTALYCTVLIHSVRVVCSLIYRLSTHL